MLMQPWLALLLADEHQRREITRAAAARHGHDPAHSLRQAVGRRIIAFGARVAAEPPRELARSR